MRTSTIIDGLCTNDLRTLFCYLEAARLFQSGSRIYRADEI